MKYQTSLESIASHPWLKKSYAKLRKDDIAMVVAFLERIEAEKLDRDGCMLACNRMFMDKKDLPKRWTLIMEICSSVITDFWDKNLP